MEAGCSSSRDKGWFIFINLPYNKNHVTDEYSWYIQPLQSCSANDPYPLIKKLITQQADKDSLLSKPCLDFAAVFKV